MNDRRFLVLLGSHRRNGNTELLAHAALDHIGDPVTWIDLKDIDLPVYDDTRHGPERHAPLHPASRELFAATLDATDIVIASPLYMYALSTLAKRYLDHWSGWGYQPGFDEAMAHKTLWGVSVLSEDDLSVAAPLARSLELSIGWLKGTYGGTLFGIGNYPGDVLKDTAALECAKTFFIRSGTRYREASGGPAALAEPLGGVSEAQAMHMTDGAGD